MVWLVLLLHCFCFKLVIGDDDHEDHVDEDDHDDHHEEDDHEDHDGVVGLTSALLLLQAGHR